MQSAEKEMDINSLKQLFQKSADVQFQLYTFNQHKIVFITCDAMIDQQLLNEVIVQRVQLFIDNLKDEPIDEAVVEQLHIPSLKKVEELKDVISLVYTGNLLLYFEDARATVFK